MKQANGGFNAETLKVRFKHLAGQRLLKLQIQMTTDKQ